MEQAMGRRPRDLMDPDPMDPKQLTSTQTKQDLLNEEIQKLATKTLLEVQQRQDIRRDLAERMKFVPPDLRVGECVFYWQEDLSKIQEGRRAGKWLRVEIIAVKGSMAVTSPSAHASPEVHPDPQCPKIFIAYSRLPEKLTQQCCGVLVKVKDSWLQS